MLLEAGSYFQSSKMGLVTSQLRRLAKVYEDIYVDYLGYEVAVEVSVLGAAMR